MKKTLLTVAIMIMAGIIYAQNVYISDANFKSYLLGNPEINTDGDNEISVSEAAGFTGTIEYEGGFLDNYAIWNEDNPINDLTGIEAFTAITGLIIPGNHLISIDLSTNTALTTLNCYHNQLNILDLSANSAITALDCSNNQISTLDISNNTALTHLTCNNNQISTLGLSSNTNLTHLTCYINEINSMDLSANTALAYLYCGSNQISTLNLNTNVALIQLWCDGNQISVLDLSANTALTGLICSNNQLTSLNLKNGNNYAMGDYCYVHNNPNLTCIQVDDTAYAIATWSSNVDTTASFSEDCNYTAVNELVNNHTAIAAYPNPTTDLIHFSEPADVQVWNITGQMVAQYSHAEVIAITGQPTGMYFLSFTDKSGQVVQRSKIVKK